MTEGKDMLEAIKNKVVSNIVEEQLNANTLIRIENQYCKYPYHVSPFETYVEPSFKEVQIDQQYYLRIEKEAIRNVIKEFNEYLYEAEVQKLKVQIYSVQQQIQIEKYRICHLENLIKKQQNTKKYQIVLQKQQIHEFIVPQKAINVQKEQIKKKPRLSYTTSVNVEIQQTYGQRQKVCSQNRENVMKNKQIKNITKKLPNNIKRLFQEIQFTKRYINQIELAGKTTVLREQKKRAKKKLKHLMQWFWQEVNDQNNQKK